MNLYLISQDVNNDYDTYSEAVVCTESAEQAQLIHPSGCQNEARRNNEVYRGSWAAVEDVQVKLIGVAAKDIPIGVICASFHAG